MTTLAIIGSGIASRSLLYTLAKEKKSYSRILVFSSESFAPACSLRSTAIVAPRGVRRGVSPLGDQIMDGYDVFLNHAKHDHPQGVSFGIQYTSANQKEDQYLKRFPDAQRASSFSDYSFKSQTLLSVEEACIVRPEIYLKWLMTKSKDVLNIFEIEKFVTSISQNEEGVQIKTQDEEVYHVDQLVLAAGHSNRFWKNLVPDSVLETSKRAKGTYIEFSNVHLGPASFSLSHNGHNLVYRADAQNLLVGNTTSDEEHDLPNLEELENIFEQLSLELNFPFPSFVSGKIIVGIREKARKRAPYLFENGRIVFFGGLYKNGYLVSLMMANKTIELLD